MRRFFEWLEDYYIYIVMIAVVAFFSLGGIASYCEKKDDGNSKEWTWNKEREEHRAAFYEKYSKLLPQFIDARDFSVWLDNTDKESIVMLYGVIEANSDEYEGDDGFGEMVDYLKIPF